MSARASGGIAGGDEAVIKIARDILGTDSTGTAGKATEVFKAHVSSVANLGLVIDQISIIITLSSKAVVGGRSAPQDLRTLSSGILAFIAVTCGGVLTSDGGDCATARGRVAGGCVATVGGGAGDVNPVDTDSTGGHTAEVAAAAVGASANLSRVVH